MVICLPVIITWVSSRKMSRAMSIIETIIPVLSPLVVPKVLVKYSIDIIELITDVEKAAKETKLLISCGGYGGRDTILSKLPLSELVLRAKLTCSPLSRVFS